MASSNSFPDIWAWIQSLPPVAQWSTDTIFTCMCSNSFPSQSSLKLCVAKDIHAPSISFSIFADTNLLIPLWTSKPLKPNPTCTKLLGDQDTTSNLLKNVIEDVLCYCPNKNTSLLRVPKPYSIPNLKDIFNFSFITLIFLICVYEAPADLRSECLNTLKNQLACPHSRDVSKQLMRLVGSNTEEQWMRSLNLAITNWILELQATHRNLKTPSPLFSYAVSTIGLWKVQLYCPVIAMDVAKASNPLPDERLQFSLNYQQLEGVIQFNYRTLVREKWIDVMVNTDNIRCDVNQLVTDTLMAERGAGTTEKHFPSRISLQLTPTLQANVLSVSVSKSSENPSTAIGREKTIEASFDPPNTYLGLKVAAGETTTTSLRPWKFEQSVHGDSANLTWLLHDTEDGREVFSSKPSKVALAINPKAWFRHRYSNVHRPFTRQGGVIFAGDKYGESVCWKLDNGAMGKSMEWEIKGWIWLTYWPNKHRTFYTETRRLEFREILTIA